MSTGASDEGADLNESLRNVGDQEALLFTKEVAACVEAIYELAALARDNPEQSKELLQRVVSIQEPLLAMLSSPNLSEDMRDNLGKLGDILSRLGEMIMEQSSLSAQFQEQQAELAREEAAADGMVTTGTQGGPEADGLGGESAAGGEEEEEGYVALPQEAKPLVVQLLTQTYKLFKFGLIDQELRGILKDLILAGQVAPARDALSKLTESAVEALKAARDREGSS